MKINKQYVLRTLFFLAGLAILFWGFSKIFEPKDNGKGYGMTNVEAAGIFGEDKNTVDAVFIGDSEAWASISPLNIYEKYGFTSYNCSTPGQQLYYTQTILERVLDVQKPSVIFVDAGILYTELYFGDVAREYARRAIPFFRYHDRWKELQLRDFTQSVKYTHKDPNKGFNFSSLVGPVNEARDYMAPTDAVESISATNQFVLKQIQYFCEKNDIQLVLVRVPDVNHWSYAKHNGTKQYAADNNLPFIDLNLELADSIDWSKDTRDHGDHLNYTGAVKVTNYLADYIHKNYALKDHRQDEKYASWDEALKSFKEVNGLD